MKNKDKIRENWLTILAFTVALGYFPISFIVRMIFNF